MKAAVAAGLVLALSACDEPSQIDAGGPPRSLEVRCDGDTTEILTPVVQAQADGVHVVVHNDSEKRLSIMWGAGGDGADPGRSTAVLPIDPGDAQFRCMRSFEDPSDDRGWQSLRVLEPPGWVSTDLRCAEDRAIRYLDYGVDADGVEDPEANASVRADGAEVVPAGYVTSEQRTYVALDGGDPTMTFTYSSDGRGGWLLRQTSSCT
jgi:hypothetical protein